MQISEYFLFDNKFELIIIYSLIFFLFVQILYYIIFYSRIFSTKSVNGNDEKPPVSVIICAKNEADNLKEFLPSVLEQNYPNYEVIVVNDSSEDSSIEILAEFRRKYEKLYFTNLEENPNFIHGKKLGITIGIKAAKNEFMVFIDADCHPVSENWLNSIIQTYTDKTEIVLAYGGYNRKRGLLNALIRFDTLFIGMHYLTFAKSGVPYMGTGRNLSYKKSIYNKQKGFSSHYHIMSGDDDLFVNKAANRRNTKACLLSESITRSVPKNKFKDYIKQKRRHLSTGKYYKFSHKFLLGGEILSRFFFYVALLLSLSFKIKIELVVSIFVLRLFIQLIVLGKAKNIFKEKGVLLLTPFFDIIIPLINLRVFISNLFIKNSKVKSWK